MAKGPRPGFKGSLAERLDRHCIPEPNSGCWLWLSSRAGKYGSIKHGGRYVYAHRASYELHRGEIPVGHMICHRCDNPMCVNPEHLFCGTGHENVRDCIAKGRSARGIRHGMAVLDEMTVSKIREQKHSGLSAKMLAATHGVTANTIREICARRLWKHVV